MDYLKSKNSSSSQDAQTQVEKPVKSLNHWDFSFFYLTLLMGMLTLIFVGFLQAFNFLFHVQDVFLETTEPAFKRSVSR